MSSNSAKSKLMNAARASTMILLLVAASAVGTVQAAANEPCDGVSDGSLKEAVSHAKDHISKVWVNRGPDWIAAYDTPDVKRNPFAIEKGATGSPALHGRVWARDVSCRLVNEPSGHLVKLTFTAAAFRFNEDGKRWSKPQKNGILVALELRQKDGQWAVIDRSAEFSVMLPEGVLRPPKSEELPDQAAWPDKRCPLPRRWAGAICAELEKGSK